MNKSVRFTLKSPGLFPVERGGRGPLNFHYERSFGGLSIKAHKHTALSGYESTLSRHWSSAKTVNTDNNLQKLVFYWTI